MPFTRDKLQREYDSFVPGADNYPKVAIELEGLAKTTSGLISLSSAGIAQQVPTLILDMRRSLTLYNASASTWWVTQSSGASGLGIPVNSGEVYSIDSYSDIHVVPIFNGQLLTYLEMS